MNSLEIGGTDKKYLETLERIRSRRIAWQNVTKPFLVNQLNNLRSEFALEWFVRTNENIHNLESVFVAFPDNPSGLATASRPYIKRGGYLNFAQLYNGKVTALVFFPFVEDISSPRGPLQIGIYEPEAVEMPLLRMAVTRFLEQMIAWEESYSIT